MQGRALLGFIALFGSVLVIILTTALTAVFYKDKAPDVTTTSTVAPTVTTEPADMHVNLSFTNISVFTADRFMIWLTCTLGYTIVAEDLPLLLDEYGIYYETVIKNNAIDVIKGAATKFGASEYYSNRTMVENGLKKAMEVTLGGTCCQQECGACIDCKPYDSCLSTDRGLFARVDDFQLKDVLFPERLREILEKQQNADPT